MRTSSNPCSHVSFVSTEYTEDETDHFSDESENEHYSDEDEERERDIHRNVFSNLPQPKLVDDNRLIQDEFASG